jgi:hypothetical protein
MNKVTRARIDAARWKLKIPGKLWYFLEKDGNMLGFVRSSFHHWDGYIYTGRKWPNSEKWVNSQSMDDMRSRTLWSARRAVEQALADLR